MDSTFDGVGLTQAQQQATAALVDLARLGRSDQANAILEEVTSSISYDAITNDTSRTDEWKRGALARQYTSLMNTLARRLTAAARSVGRQDSDDAAHVLGVAGLSGDAASLSISRRDASDRVTDLNDALGLQRLLAQATRIGDECLARAIAEKALSLGDADTLNAFTADRPKLAPAIERLWSAQFGKTTTLDSKVQFWLVSLKPAAISKLQDYEIEAAAAGQTSAGSWNVTTG
jgi:hypothetical protein